MNVICANCKLNICRVETWLQHDHTEPRQQKTAGAEWVPGQEVPRAAAPRPAQDSAQEAAAAPHLRPGRGVEEDRSEETHLPGPRTAKIRNASKDHGGDHEVLLSGITG